MLVTDPRSRASLTEVMQHPWMTKGSSGPPDNYLPHREPLQLPLDESVIEKMHGFDFGSPEYIKRQLTSILNTEDYQRAVKHAAKRPQGSGEDRKKGMFDFYQRRKSNSSKDTLSPPSSEAVHLGEDPVNAYNPLLSIYYLVREKQDREKLEANPGAFAMPQSPGQKPLQLPDLPAPEPAFTNIGAFEMAGEAPTGGRTRPRARTQGEDDRTDTPTKPAQLSQTPVIKAPPSDAPKKESTAAGLLRRFSTRRGRDSSRHGEREREKESTQQLAPEPTTAPPESTLAPPRNSFSVRKTRDTPPSAYKEVANKHPDLLAPPNETAGPAKRLKGLGRSTSVNSGDLKRRWSTRRGASDSTAAKKPTTSESEKASLSDAPKPQADASSDDSHTQQSANVSSRARSTGHSRRGSVNQRSGRVAGIDSDVPEETDQEVAEAEEAEGGQPFTRPNPSQETMKPVYLKGLFSVSTTSNKPLTFIRADIIRVLQQLGVEYREIKGGFSCRHLPSIDLNKVVDDPEGAQKEKERESRIRQSFSHRRKISFAGIREKGEEKDELRAPLTPKTPSRRLQTEASNYTTDEDAASDSDRDRALHSWKTRRYSSQAPRSSDTPGSSTPVPLSPRPMAIDPMTQQAPKPTEGPSYAARPAGETTTHVQSDLGQSMILRFEILVVKVPLLSLHGLQFKKVDGGTWQYKKMAEEILSLLKL